MNWIWALILGILAGVILGVFLSRFLLKKEAKKYPMLNEQNLQIIAKFFGRKLNQSQLKQITSQLKK